MKIGFVSLGCPKNLVDSEVMLGMAEKDGHEITADAAQADVLVVNTCAFIDRAKQESIDTILITHLHPDHSPATEANVSSPVDETTPSDSTPSIEAEAGTSEFAPLDPGPEGVFQAERDTAARNRHMKRLYTSCLAYNRSMQALARKFNADLTFETDEVLGVLEAPDATSATQFNEALDDATGFATAVLDLQRRWFNPFQTFRIFSPGQH